MTFLVKLRCLYIKTCCQSHLVSTSPHHILTKTSSLCHNKKYEAQAVLLSHVLTRFTTRLFKVFIHFIEHSHVANQYKLKQTHKLQNSLVNVTG